MTKKTSLVVKDTVESTESESYYIYIGELDKIEKLYMPDHQKKKRKREI